MGSGRSAGTRRLVPVLALSAVVIGAIATLALAAGPADGTTSGTAVHRDRTRWTSSPPR
jgi:hypothetical protein